MPERPPRTAFEVAFLLVFVLAAIGYLSKVYFAYRAFALHPSDAAAKQLWIQLFKVLGLWVSLAIAALLVSLVLPSPTKKARH